MTETTLYPAVKAYLEQAGFEVKGEINGCDVVAVKSDEAVRVAIVAPSSAAYLKTPRPSWTIRTLMAIDSLPQSRPRGAANGPRRIRPAISRRTSRISSSVAGGSSPAASDTLCDLG